MSPLFALFQTNDFIMKGSGVMNTIVITVALFSSVSSAIHHPAATLKTSSSLLTNQIAVSSVAEMKTQSVLFKLRGGELDSASTDDAIVSTDDDISSSESSIAEIVEDSMSSTSSEQVINNKNGNLLITLLSPFNTARTYYMDRLHTYPVSTIIVTVALVSLLMKNILAASNKKDNDEDINVNGKNNKVININIDELTIGEPSKRSSVGLLRGVGTVMATSFAIYQVVTSRPPMSIHVDDRSDQLTNYIPTEEKRDDVDGDEENKASMFKGVLLQKNRRN